MRRISVSKSPTTAPSKCARSSIKPHPPKADAAAVYARWGISLSDAINIFLAKSIEVGGLPFDMRPETPTFDGLERYAYRPTLDSNGVARLPGDWDDGE